MKKHTKSWVTVKFQFRGFRLWNWKNKSITETTTKGTVNRDEDLSNKKRSFWVSPAEGDEVVRGTWKKVNGRWILGEKNWTLTIVGFGFYNEALRNKIFVLCCEFGTRRVTLFLLLFSLVFRWVWRTFPSSSSSSTIFIFIFICFFTNTSTIFIFSWKLSINKKKTYYYSDIFFWQY